jgi:hypothetical protein
LTFPWGNTLLVGMIHRFINALSYAFEMGWKIFWALLLGFTLSGAVQAVVTKGG